MKQKILSCENLYKKFGSKQIIKNLSLELYEGNILGFIGPNGAGKTTTIKMILGLQRIDSGKVTIKGYDVTDNFEEAIRHVGAIVENPDMYMYLSGRKNLELVCNMYKDIPKSRIDEVVQLVGLKNRINDKVSKYSLGMRQRLGIAQALIHNPEILILDEPTNGLDPEGIKELRDLLKRLANKENKSVLISSHNLSELESFCSSVCIIKNGEVVETNKVQSIKKEISHNTYYIEIDNVKKVLKMISNAKEYNESTIEIIINKEEIPDLIEKLVENKVKIYSVQEMQISLEDAFLNRVRGAKND